MNGQGGGGGHWLPIEARHPALARTIWRSTIYVPQICVCEDSSSRKMLELFSGKGIRTILSF